MTPTDTAHNVTFRTLLCFGATHPFSRAWLAARLPGCWAGSIIDCDSQARHSTMAEEPIINRVAQLRQIFDEIDTDGSGHISKDELATALEKGGKDASPEAIEKILAEVDLNKDGEISFSEFETVFNRAPDELPTALSSLVSMGSFMLNKVVKSPARGVLNAASATAGAVAGAVTYPFREKTFAEMHSSDIKNAILKAKKEAARRRLAKLKNAQQAVTIMKQGAFSSA